jgi:hypothetical protein
MSSEIDLRGWVGLEGSITPIKSAQIWFELEKNGHHTGGHIAIQGVVTG